MHEKELQKPDKEGLRDLEKMQAIIKYLYTGKTFKYKGYNYRMDGCFNPYIVPVDKDGQPVSREENKFPLFQNECFWNTLIEMTRDMSDEDYIRIKTICSGTFILNKGSDTTLVAFDSGTRTHNDRRGML